MFWCPDHYDELPSEMSATAVRMPWHSALERALELERELERDLHIVFGTHWATGCGASARAELEILLQPTQPAPFSSDSSHNTPATPAATAAPEHLPLRRHGLSQAKAGTLREVAKLADIGAFDDLDSLSDDDVRERLTAIKGIGPWTAHMVMMFALGRPDVWPVGDVGIQRAARQLYNADGRDALEILGERFRPYRSHAAWYLWRSLG